MSDQFVEVPRETNLNPQPVAQPVVPPVVEQPKPYASPQIEAEARRAKELFRKQKEIKAQELALQKRQEELEQREKAIAAKKKNPIDLLQEFGYTYDDATQTVLEKGKVTPDIKIRQLEQEIEADRQARQQEKEEQIRLEAQAQEAQVTQVVQQFQDKIAKHIEANKGEGKYGLTATVNDVPMIYAIIDEHYKKTAEQGNPEIMELDKACELAEKYYLDLVENALQNTYLKTKYKKIDDKTVEETKDAPGFVPKPKTLTNDMANSTSPKSDRWYSDEERLNRAKAALDAKVK